MLEANPDLTWRDVKHILVTGSEKIDDSRSTSLEELLNIHGLKIVQDTNIITGMVLERLMLAVAAQDITPKSWLIY